MPKKTDVPEAVRRQQARLLQKGSAMLLALASLVVGAFLVHVALGFFALAVAAFLVGRAL